MRLVATGKFGVISVILVFGLCASLFGQKTSQVIETVSFHIEGTVISPWDSLLRGVAVPRSKVTFHGEQAIRTLGTDDKDSYIAIPRTEITFRGERATRTVIVDEKGFYRVDLPLGVYKMTAYGPAIRSQALTEYTRVFRVLSPATIVLNGTLYIVRTNCDAVVGADTEEQEMEAWKNICGGEDSFAVSSKVSTPLQIYIRYPQRQTNNRSYLYSSYKNVPVFVAFNLFSLEANAVVYDLKSRTIAASGNVIVEDGSGTMRRAESLGFRIEDDQVIPLN